MGTLFSVVHPSKPIAGDLRIRPLLAAMSHRTAVRAVYSTTKKM